MNHDLFCLIHAVLNVEIIYVHAHVAEDYVGDDSIDI